MQSLVSLDLSSNHFDDLKDLVLNKMKKLEKLKNLILYGNPISVNNHSCSFRDSSGIDNNHLMLP